MDLDDWDFPLPPDRIARHPAPERHGSRLMLLPIAGGGPSDFGFRDLGELLRPGDLLVANDTRVMPARLFASRATGGAIEILVLDPGPGAVRALLRPARRIGDGELLRLRRGGTVRVLGREAGADGVFRLEFDSDPAAVMEHQGEMPLPPYLERDADERDRTRYQTVYAGPLGAAAAPTAGLHFTQSILDELRQRGVGFATVTLHVGLGTFRPLRSEDVARGRLHRETYRIPAQTALSIDATRSGGGRVIAVGTTSARALETATPEGHTAPVVGAGETELLIGPGYRFRSVDGLLTNFHLPKSSLLLLVAALVGRERLLGAYAQAVERGYRFYSYGDAMLLV